MSDDAKLQHAVLGALSREPSVDAGHIGVTAADGVVTLSGHVDSFAQKHAAEAAAHTVRGVRAVVERMDVRLGPEIDVSDEALAAAAVDHLAWDTSVPKGAVIVDVEDGWITLTGEVPWNFQREAAEQDIRRLAGVVGVTNEITIKPQVDAGNVSDDIMHALRRSWFFDPKTITVTAEGGRVRLTGTVSSPRDRQLAATIAWAAPGVTDVDNAIVVA